MEQDDNSFTIPITTVKDETKEESFQSPQDVWQETLESFHKK